MAVSDPSGSIAFPLTTLKLSNFKNRAALLDELAKQIQTTGAEEVVIGLPLSLEGEETLTCKQVRNMAGRLKRRCGLPVRFMPETLSSRQAWHDLKESGMKTKNFKKVLDQQAACRILQSFLDAPDSRSLP